MVEPCTGACLSTLDGKLLNAAAERQKLIDVLQLHGDVALLTLPHSQIPDRLGKLCNSTIACLYSTHGRLQYIDVFIHLYIARLLMLIDDTRKRYSHRPP